MWSKVTTPPPDISYLQHLQLLQSLLDQLLLLPVILHILVLPECVARSPPCVLAEVICCELLALTQELTVLSEHISTASMRLCVYKVQDKEITNARPLAPSPILQHNRNRRRYNTYKRECLVGRVALEGLYGRHFERRCLDENISKRWSR